MENLLYSNKLLPVVARVDRALSWRPQSLQLPLSGLRISIQPKLVLFSIGLMFTLWLGQSIVGGVKDSRQDFYASFSQDAVASSVLNPKVSIAQTLPAKSSSKAQASRAISSQSLPQTQAIQSFSTQSVPQTIPSFMSEPESTQARQLGKAMNAKKFGNRHWGALHKLWTSESGWNPAARNSSSGACGIPQALPCNKITDKSTRGQLKWGLNYIQRRYGNPTKAWNFWLIHHWY